MSGRSTGADARPNGDATPRQHHDGSSGRAYTVEQKAAVIRIRRCQATAFYEILGLEQVKATCSDSEIKKAYRKLSLLTHPDKNGYEGADEAFKKVSRAFQVLSDAEKKAKFDKFGGDPDSRFGAGGGGAGQSPFSGFARSSSGRQGPMFEEEISPEEMFRQFFGGGAAFGGGPFGGGIFDTGPGFVFNLGGGPGVRVHQFGGGRPRRRPDTAQPPGSEPPTGLANTLSALLPLLFLFVLPLLTSIFSGGSGPQGPSVVFESPRGAYSQGRTSHKLKVPYWVDPRDTQGYSNRDYRHLDERAETQYIHKLGVQCENEQYQQSKMIQDAQGWLFQDEAKMQQARKMPMPNCKKLRDFGLRY